MFGNWGKGTARLNEQTQLYGKFQSGSGKNQEQNVMNYVWEKIFPTKNIRD